MSKRLHDRVVLVTGGASGIGRAAAIAAAKEGAIVVVSDRDKVGGEESVSKLISDSPESIFLPIDVSDEASVKSVIDKVISQYGRLDAAFNNAGIEFVGKPIQELSLDDWNRATGVNLTGVFLCMKYEIQAMLKHGKGSIVNTASACGEVAIPVAAEYVATKHGVIGLTKAAAADTGELGIRVNAVLPGSVDTPMMARLLEGASEFSEAVESNVNRHLLKRRAKPEEIAAAVIWLLSDEASFITGTPVPVDGGYLAN